jgi:hypothetical protein
MVMDIVCHDGVTRPLVVQEVGRGNARGSCDVCGAVEVWCGQWWTETVDNRAFGGFVCEPCGSVRRMK